MFAQKYNNYWNDCNSAHSYQPYHYNNDHEQLRTHNTDATYTYNSTNNNGNGMSPTSSTCSKTSDYAQEYLKELLEKIEREKYHTGIQKEQTNTVDSKQNLHYNNCIVNTSPIYTPNLETPDIDTEGSRLDSCKKSTILSRFYKPDGTPVKGLWDSEANNKEQRAYKYEPKPLERRKTPRSFVPEERKSNEYWEKRRKNNIAARKSREDRRKKEIETLKSVDNLKNDNIKLKIYAQKVMNENQNLKYEIDMLKRL